LKNASFVASRERNFPNLVAFLFSLGLQRRVSRDGLAVDRTGAVPSVVGLHHHLHHTVNPRHRSRQLQQQQQQHDDHRPPESVGSSDPLLQIPSELSAVLTLKRGGANGKGGGRHVVSAGRNTVSADNGQCQRTPLLKKKRESIV
jgi:hypothetical protein